MPKCASSNCDHRVLSKTIFCSGCQINRKSLTNKDKPKEFVPRIYKRMEMSPSGAGTEHDYQVDSVTANAITDKIHPVDIPMGHSYLMYSLDGGAKSLLTRDPTPIAGYSQLLMIYRFGEIDYEFQAIVTPNIIPTLKQLGKLLVKEFSKSFQVAPIRSILEDSFKPTIPP